MEAVRELVIAGWTGRDEAALRKHIRELRRLEFVLLARADGLWVTVGSDHTASSTRKAR
jgi:hypothetical protein